MSESENPLLIWRSPDSGPDGWLFPSEKLTTPLAKDNAWWASKWRSAHRNEPSLTKISFDKHSSLTDRTQRSAYAFRFGLLGGKARGLMPPASMTSRNEEQNL